MRVRWTVATLAALSLAWTMLAIEMPWLGVVAESQTPAGAACPADAKPAPLAFTLKDVDNKEVRLSDHKGKVILLDFWATWCGPCKVEIPWFIEFQNRYGKAGFQAIGISVDDPLDKLRPYVASMKMNYIVLQGLGNEKVQDAYGPMLGLPVTALISRDGRICAKHTGMASKTALEQQIKALL
jgi:thiol-disulfide isomerase/thioredoxin